MDLDIIKEFTLLAETCNFQVTAERLSMSQSALSKHIHRLEEELKMDLFDRSKRSVTLNENGEEFLGYARKICKLCDECSYAMNKRREARISVLKIGLMKPYDQNGLMDKLTSYFAEKRDVQMTMLEYSEGEIKAKLTTGECDFVFTSDISEYDKNDFEIKLYEKDRLVVLLPEDHPLASKGNIDIEELAGEKLIFHSSGFGQKFLEEMLNELDAGLDEIARVSYISTILRMVNQGMGLTIVGNSCLIGYQGIGVVKAELKQDTEFSIYLVCSKRKLSGPACEFIDYFSSDET